MMEKYQVEIKNRPDGFAAVLIDGGFVRQYTTTTAAKAFVDGIFYDGYDRDQLLRPVVPGDMVLDRIPK